MLLVSQSWDRPSLFVKQRCPFYSLSSPPSLFFCPTGFSYHQQVPNNYADHPRYLQALSDSVNQTREYMQRGYLISPAINLLSETWKQSTRLTHLDQGRSRSANQQHLCSRQQTQNTSLWLLVFPMFGSLALTFNYF